MLRHGTREAPFTGVFFLFRADANFFDGGVKTDDEVCGAGG